MSKRQIRGQYGKQLYLNKIFHRGMLYTSSEMLEGYVKALSNYDITPTGDAATPRIPFALIDHTQTNISKYLYPVRFQQARNYQHYIEFANVISEADFVNDVLTRPNPRSATSIKFFSRGNDAMSRDPIGEVDYDDCLVVDVPGTETTPTTYKYDHAAEITLDGQAVLENNNTTDIGEIEADDIEYLIPDLAVDGVSFYPIDVTDYSLLNFFDADAVTVIDGDTIRIKERNGVAYPITNTVLAEFVGEALQFGPITAIDFSSRSITLQYVITETNDPMQLDNVRLAYNQATFNTLFTDINYRLLGINCPETGHEWSLYGTHVLGHLLENLTSLKMYADPNADDTDAYGRKLRWIAFTRTSPNYEGHYYLANDIMVRLGVAKIQHMYDAYVHSALLQASQTAAQAANLRMWSETDTDPLYTYYRNNIDYMDVRAALNIASGSTMYIDAIKLNASSYVSGQLVNTIDRVEFVYVDYLDAITFIGRIVVGNNILYKGPMMLKCVMERDLANFELVIPDNDGEGYFPTLSEAVSIGYNLLNSDLINTENTHSSYLETGILGLVATEPTDDDIIITQATPGGTVRLHGIINEGSFTESGNVALDPLVFDAKIGVTHRVVYSSELNIGQENPVVHSDEEYIPTPDIEEIGLSNNNTGYLSPYYTAARLTQLLEAEEYMHGAGVLGVTITSITYTITVSYTVVMTAPVAKEFSGTITFTPINANTETLTDKFAAMHIFNNVLQVGLKLDLQTPLNRYASLNVVSNGDNVRTIYDASATRVANSSLPGRVFYSKWEKSQSGSDWTLLDGEPFKNYVMSGSAAVAYNDEPNYIDYVVDQPGNMMLKYSLIPAFELPDEDTYIFNSFQVMYQVMPTFRIGGEWKTISNESLTENIDIRNATRIGLYNRQLFVYGEYSKSNFIQFSMFEKPWYLPFPFYNIAIDEKIVHVHQHKDNLVIFGQYNIYMLINTESTSATALTLFKIYENLSISKTEIDTVRSIGNNIMFLNRQMGYVIVPNKFTSDPQDIQVYKLTDNISNMLANPAGYLKQRLSLDSYCTILNNSGSTNGITASYMTFIENNTINIVVSYEIKYLDAMLVGHTTDVQTAHMVIFYRYNQTFKYWSLYDTKIYDAITSGYICEPHLGYQFIVTKGGYSYFGIPINQELPVNFPYARAELGLTATEFYRVETFIDSGFLSVDTMNDKRFKDLIFEFNNIGGASLDLFCNFFVDGTPILLTEIDAITLDPTTGYVLQESIETATTIKFGENYGFSLSDSTFGNAERTRVRYPVWGKGRMPQFTLVIRAEDNYELLNFSLIYKEKNIERR